MRKGETTTRITTTRRTASPVADWSREIHWESKRTTSFSSTFFCFSVEVLYHKKKKKKQVAFIFNRLVLQHSRLWGWSGVGHAITSMATPPESPHAALMRDTSLQYEDAIIPELDIYAIPSKEGMCRLFSLHESYVYCMFLSLRSVVILKS